MCNSNHDPLLEKVKKTLDEDLKKHGDLDKVRPATLKDKRFNAIRVVVNDEVADFLKSILDSYVSMLLLLESKAQKERNVNCRI